MTTYLDKNTLRFQLFSVHQLENLLKRSRFQDFDADAIRLFLDSVEDFADRELHPYFREMDEHPAHWQDGKIIVHPQIGVVMRQGGEMGLTGSIFNAEDGGMQLPVVAHTAAFYILEAANNHIPGYLGLTLGAAELLLEFANEDLKKTYVPPMLAGLWAGTMCLTEPQAGSSLSDITTIAYVQPDGSFRLKGQKIFISGGDHEYCENFVHLVLARIEGAPAGTKGISLFVVPKRRLTDDNSLIFNDVTTAGDFQKLGQRGYCTTHLAFGENNDCYGWLVGEMHRGLACMFQMMNGARIAVGRDAAAIVAAACAASWQYASERPQGRRLTSGGKKDISQEPSLIIEHADVRRMLFFQKAVSEVSLSIVLQTALYQDLAHTSEGEEREKWHLLLELLTPVAKTYPSEKGKQAVDAGLQVLGGYGFCSDFVLQQYFRDIRIMSLYEGTTGIQSLDLLGRKITMENGRGLQFLMEEIRQTLDNALDFSDLQPYVSQLEEKMKLVQQVLDFLLSFARQGEHERFLSDATLFMEFFGHLVAAWQWLKMGTAAKQALLLGDSGYSAVFLEEKIHLMRFYFKYELPQTVALAEILMKGEVLTILEAENR